MGFLDKAKKLAEQAQTKLDEVQSQVNQQRGSQPPGAPTVDYDQHGRPIPPQQSASPPHGDPLTGAPSEPPVAPSGPTADPNAPVATHGDPLEPAGVPPTEPPSGPPEPVEGSAPPPPAPGMPGGNDQDRNRGDYAPPKLTGGDPLAG
jgi:hypothetical protein